jgi:hypothetical protein
LQIVRSRNITECGRPTGRRIGGAEVDGCKQTTKLGTIFHDPDQPDPDPGTTDGRPEAWVTSTALV